MKSDFGSILVKWRTTRRVSQLDLALSTAISQKHISFIELGRARPSREMVLKLASGLDLPLRARNDLLLSAGYAPLYLERRLDLAEMQCAREALELILHHHEPYPAIVTDSDWNIILQNEAAGRLIAFCISANSRAQISREVSVNFMRLMFTESGIRPFIQNWTYTRAALLARLRREARANPGSPSDRLLRELNGKSQARDYEVNEDERLDPVLSLELLVRGRRLRLFSAFTTFGTPQDITLQELRIDLSFPADQPTREFLVAADRTRAQGVL
jgi:transcriptional regulator with XRE-family HTH domain